MASWMRAVRVVPVWLATESSALSCSGRRRRLMVLAISALGGAPGDFFGMDEAYVFGARNAMQKISP